MVHLIVRLSPSLIFFGWALAASTDGVATFHIVFLVLLGISFAASELERLRWRRKRGL